MVIVVAAVVEERKDLEDELSQALIANPNGAIAKKKRQLDAVQSEHTTSMLGMYKVVMSL